MDGYTSTAGEQARQHHEAMMPGGDREAWRLHPLLNHCQCCNWVFIYSMEVKVFFQA